MGPLKNCCVSSKTKQNAILLYRDLNIVIISCCAASGDSQPWCVGVRGTPPPFTWFNASTLSECPGTGAEVPVATPPHRSVNWKFVVSDNEVTPVRANVRTSLQHVSALPVSTHTWTSWPAWLDGNFYRLCFSRWLFVLRAQVMYWTTHNFSLKESDKMSSYIVFFFCLFCRRHAPVCERKCERSGVFVLQEQNGQRGRVCIVQDQNSEKAEECSLFYIHKRGFEGSCEPRFMLWTRNQTVFLHLAGLTPEDSSKYTCECSNSVGMHNLSLNITVEGE